MTFALGFYAGALFGFALGVIVLSMLTVGKRADRVMEQWRKERGHGG